LILDTPSIEHIPSLIRGFESGVFSKYWGKQQEIKDHALRVVFHLCGDEVAGHERYKAFMNGFKDDVHVGTFVPRTDVHGDSDAIESSILLHLEITCQIRLHLPVRRSTS
jgi:hypothetical protein